MRLPVRRARTPPNRRRFAYDPAGHGSRTARDDRWASVTGSLVAMPVTLTRPWPGACPTRHLKTRVQDRRPDDDRNRPRPSLRTVGRTGTTFPDVPSVRTGLRRKDTERRKCRYSEEQVIEVWKERQAGIAVLERRRKVGNQRRGLLQLAVPWWHHIAPEEPMRDGLAQSLSGRRLRRRRAGPRRAAPRDASGRSVHDGAAVRAQASAPAANRCFSQSHRLPIAPRMVWASSWTSALVR